jgi:hypothetical protein
MDNLDRVCFIVQLVILVVLLGVCYLLHDRVVETKSDLAQLRQDYELTTLFQDELARQLNHLTSQLED